MSKVEINPFGFNAAVWMFVVAVGAAAFGINRIADTLDRAYRKPAAAEAQK